MDTDFKLIQPMELSSFTISMIQDCHDIQVFLFPFDFVTPDDNSADIIDTAVVLYYNFLRGHADKYGYKPVKEDK